MSPPDREIKLLGCLNSYLFAPHPFPSCPLTVSIKVYFVSCPSYYVKLFWKALQKSEKSQKVSEAWKKPNLMVDLHLLHLPREGRRWLRKSGSSWEKSQRQESLVVYQKSKTGTQKQTHFISKRTLMVGMIRCWKKKIPMKAVECFSSDTLKLWADACWSTGFSQAQVIVFLIGVCNFMVHIIWSSD